MLPFARGLIRGGAVSKVRKRDCRRGVRLHVSLLKHGISSVRLSDFDTSSLMFVNDSSPFDAAVVQFTVSSPAAVTTLSLQVVPEEADERPW